MCVACRLEMDFEQHEISPNHFQELDLKIIYIDEILYYLKGHQKDYRWALFLHEEHHKCDVIPGSKGKPLKYYHMLI